MADKLEALDVESFPEEERDAALGVLRAGFAALAAEPEEPDTRSAIDRNLGRTVYTRHGTHDQSSHGNRFGASLPSPDIGMVEQAESAREALRADASFSHSVPDAAVKASAQVRTRAKAVGEDVTSDVTDTLDETGGSPVGLAQKFKGAKSTLRKVVSDAAEDGVPIPKAADEMSDSLRYTGSFQSEDYVNGSDQTLGQLSEDYELVKSKNYWQDDNSSNPYNGINAVFEDPESGHRFEVQLHTPESFDMKENQLHPLYEEARKLPPGSERRAELEREMVSLASSLPKPEGVEQVLDTRAMLVSAGGAPMEQREQVGKWRYYLTGNDVPFRKGPGLAERWDGSKWVEAYDSFMRKWTGGDGFLTEVSVEELPEAARP